MKASATAVATSEVTPDEILAFRAGVEFDAFAELYGRHLCSIYRFVRAQVPSDATAEDLTAQVFFNALNSAETYRGESRYSAWLFRIARNVVANWRRGRQDTFIDLDQVSEEPDSTPCPETQTLTGDARRIVWGTISSLPPTQREAIVLRYIEDLSIDEVASATGKSRGAVRVLLHRARARLRKALGEKGLA